MKISRAIVNILHPNWFASLHGIHKQALRIFSVLLLAVTVPAHALSTQWSITDLGSLGGSYTMPTGINSLGQVVGYGQLSSGEDHAFLYSGGSISGLGTLGGSNSYARDINDAGQVIGYSNIVGGADNAFLYNSGIGMVSLGTLGGTNSQATAINQAGQIVGRSQSSGDADWKAFIVNGSMSQAGLLSDATDINNGGQVLGQAGADAVIYNSGSGTITPLGVPEGGCCFLPSAMNDLGQVVGTGQPKLEVSDVPHAFLYSDGSLSDLGTLNGPGGSDSRGLGINNAGQAVGWSNFQAFDDAFIYSDGSMTNLSLLPDVVAAGWRLQAATAINNEGQIVGWGSLNGDQYRAFLLTPVPEPETYLLLLAGLGLISFAMRKKSF